jgi:hypothetical protein
MTMCLRLEKRWVDGVGAAAECIGEDCETCICGVKHMTSSCSLKNQRDARIPVTYHAPIVTACLSAEACV